MEQKTIAIIGMSCGHCVAGIKRALNADVLVAMDCHWKFAVNDVL